MAINPEAHELQARADVAAQKRIDAEAALYNSDGRQIYSPDEHNERLSSLKAARDEEISWIAEKADNFVTESRYKLDNIENADPAASLSADELAAANRSRPFVAEDAAEMELSELVGRARSVAASGDRAQAYLWGRYALKRHNDEFERLAQNPDAPDSASTGAALSELKEIVPELNALVRGSSDELALGEAQRQLNEAVETSQYVRSRSLTHEEKLAASNLAEMRL